MRALSAALTVWCALNAAWAIGAERETEFEPVDLSRPAYVLTGVDAAAEPIQSPPPQKPKAARHPPPCLAREPDAAEIIRGAWRIAGLLPAADERRLARLDLAAWLPKLSAGVAMDLGDRWDYRYEPGEPRVDQLHQDDGWRWELDLSWDLSRLAYQSEELQLAREAERRASLRRGLAVEVARLFWRRKRSLLGGWPAATSPAHMQVEEMTAVLDAWTGGRFANLWCRRRER